MERVIKTTHLLEDILEQPAQLIRSLRHAMGPGREQLQRAASAVRDAKHVFLTGIGSSWHAVLAANALFYEHGRPVNAIDASELVHFSELPEGSVVIVLSRSGKSIEVVQLLSKARAANALVIGITNDADSPLGKQAGISLLMSAAFDFQVSVTMYSAPLMIGTLLALASLDRLESASVDALERSLAAASEAMHGWQAAIEESDWLATGETYYFLGRGESLASCYEARLLWEEATKCPACAMGTGTFRHGPQESVTPGFRLGVWLDPNKMRHEDIALVTDLRKLGAKVMLIGQGVDQGMADLVLRLPAVPAQWQCMLDIMPVQLAAERFSRLRGVDCDSFQICTYIIETDGGLLPAVQ